MLKQQKLFVAELWAERLGPAVANTSGAAFTTRAIELGWSETVGTENVTDGSA